jgi:hypothetical protein
LILTAGDGESGTFSNITGDTFTMDGYDWTITYDDAPDEITIEATSAVTSTPEPDSLVLLGSGLLGLVGFLKRRNAARRAS